MRARTWVVGSRFAAAAVPERDLLDSGQPDVQPSPLDHAIAAGLLDDYDAALARLDESDRDLLVARIEMGLSYAEIAEVCGKPNANAARSAVVRALGRLHQELRGEGLKASWTRCWRRSPTATPWNGRRTTGPVRRLGWAWRSRGEGLRPARLVGLAAWRKGRGGWRRPR